MKTKELLSRATKSLKQAGIATAHLDSLVLLEDLTGKGRSWLLAHQEHKLDEAIVKKLDKQVARRGKHEPLAYIRGKSEFYGREFKVNAHTLQPRPETETMIDLLKQLIASLQSPVFSEKKQVNNKSTDIIVDIGTGSGCIAISAKILFPDAKVVAIDIDKKCLTTAKQNAKLHNASIDFQHGNLLEPLSSIKHRLSNIIIMANLPYVPESHTINKAATYEPEHAIFGGADGLKYYRELFEQTKNIKPRPLAILTEALPPQHTELTTIAKQLGYQLSRQQDFIQVFTLQI